MPHRPPSFALIRADEEASRHLLERVARAEPNARTGATSGRVRVIVAQATHPEPRAAEYCSLASRVCERRARRCAGSRPEATAGGPCGRGPNHPDGLTGLRSSAADASPQLSWAAARRGRTPRAGRRPHPLPAVRGRATLAGPPPSGNEYLAVPDHQVGDPNQRPCRLRSGVGRLGVLVHQRAASLSPSSSTASVGRS